MLKISNLTGSTRAFPPHHPLIPVDYQLTGQPVLIGGTMGSCSYVLTGTDCGMENTFGYVILVFFTYLLLYCRYALSIKFSLRLNKCLC